MAHMEIGGSTGMDGDFSSSLELRSSHQPSSKSAIRKEYNQAIADFKQLISGIDDLNYDSRMGTAKEELLRIYELSRKIRGFNALAEDEKIFFQESMNFVDRQFRIIPGSPKYSGNGDRMMNRRINGDLLVVHYLETALNAVRLFSPPKVETVTAAAGHDLGEDHRNLEKILRTHNFSRALNEFVGVSWDRDLQDYALAFQGLINGLSDYKDGNLDKSDPVARKRRELNSLVHIYLQSLSDIRVLQIKISDRMLNVRDISDLSEQRGLKMLHETFQAYLDAARSQYFPQEIYSEFMAHIQKSDISLPRAKPATEQEVASYMLNHVVSTGRELVDYLDSHNPALVDEFKTLIAPQAQNGFRKVMVMPYAKSLYDLILDPNHDQNAVADEFLNTPERTDMIKRKLTEWRFARVFLNYEPTAQLYTELDSKPLERPE